MEEYFILSDLMEMIIVLSIVVVLPISIIWLVTRNNTHKINKRTEIILSAIEKNPEIDIEDFMRKALPPQKSVKEKLSQKLLLSCLCGFPGIACCLICLFLSFGGGYNSESFWWTLFIGLILIAIGLAYVVSFFIGKKIFSEEIQNNH